MIKSTRIFNLIGCIVVYMILMQSCNNTNKRLAITPDAPPKESLIDKILETGDVMAYNEFGFYYPTDFSTLPISIYMGEQKKYGRAYYYIYTTLYSAFNEFNIEIDSNTQKYMLSCLEKGIELSDTDCVVIMSRLLMTGTLIEKDTVMAKKNLMRVFKLDDVEHIYWPLLKRQEERLKMKNR